MTRWARGAVVGVLAGCGNAFSAEAPATAPGVDLPSGAETDVQRTLDFFASRPVYERPLGTGAVAPQGLPGIRAADCAVCHAEIAAEWASSTHAHAWVDAQFQAEIQKSDNRWLCVNCHTPLLKQQDQWPIDLVGGDVEKPIRVSNPTFDHGLRSEGITCAACHLADDGTIRGPGLSTPSLAPHPTTVDADFQGEGLCLRCHQATAEYPGKTFVCTFRTGEEWSDGPWSTEGVGCVDCHMPRVERAAAIGGPKRKVARHTWRGAGIPKVPGVQPPIDTNPPGLEVEARWMGPTLDLRLINARAGHRLPSGDPERFVRVEVYWTDAQDRPVGEPYVLRIGQTWRWWPSPEKLADNRIAPREQRAIPIPIPRRAHKAEIVASSHRMTEDIRAYHHLDGYPISIVTHRLRASASGTTGGLVRP